MEVRFEKITPFGGQRQRTAGLMNANKFEPFEVRQGCIVGKVCQAGGVYEAAPSEQPQKFDVPDTE